MEEEIAHQGMRDELLLWLSDATSGDDTQPEGLEEFLLDDFPYDAEHVVGLVLRQHELQPWQELMAALKSLPASGGDNECSVLERAAALLAAMQS